MAVVQSQFALSVREWVERTKKNADQACRKIALEIATRVVLKTPVGNPELWKANADAQYMRETHNLFAAAINASIAADPASFTRSGNLRKGVRRAKIKSAKSLAKEFPFRAGKGYVGGRLRANWFVTIGTASTATTDQVDPSGAQAIAAAQAALSSFKAGSDIFIVNNLPYAVPIEYGHSTKQAPAGVVRVTLAEVDVILNKAVQSVAT